MPFYEYHCSRCGHHHEELQKVTDKPLRKCPECGRNALKRLMSAPVFRLKGGGWYETDFKSDKEGQRNLAGEKEPAEKKVETADKPAVPVEKKADTPGEKKESPGKTTVAAKKPPRGKTAARKPAARKAAGRRPRR
jgi:putative FmdB family regulatory protein